MNKCKRMEVKAVGIGQTVEFAMNGNKGECNNIPGKCGCTHAEEELLKKIENPTVVFITHSPCLNCAKLLLKSGVRQVLYNEEYRILDGVSYLRENGVKVSKIKWE